MGGEAMVWNGSPQFPGQDELIGGLFSRQVEEAYQELFDRLGQPGADFAEAAVDYMQIKQKDYFNSALGQEVRQRLVEARGSEL